MGVEIDYVSVEFKYFSTGIRFMAVPGGGIVVDQKDILPSRTIINKKYSWVTITFIR